MSEKADIQKPKGRSHKSKEELLRSNQEYLNALENQIADLKSNTKDWAKKGLIIGGVLLATYKIAQLLFFEDDESTTDEKLKPINTVYHKKESAVFNAVKSSVSLFLVGLAKQKLKDFLNNLNSDNE